MTLRRTSWLSRHHSLGPLDGRHLAIIINIDDPLSRDIGRYYQRARNIPAEQVFHINLPTSRKSVDPDEFVRIKRRLDEKIPSYIQVYALAWLEPYQVGCQSITSAFTFGYDPKHCASGCRTTKLSTYYARGDVRRPWQQLKIRPSMLLSAANITSVKKMIARGVQADGTSPPGTAYLLSTSDFNRNVRARRYPYVVATTPSRFGVKIIQSNALIGANDVMAYFTGLAFVPGIRTNRYRPGAIADHLTSFGGQLSGSSQMSISEWIEAGATASYGTVVEPCSYISKFPDPGLVLAYYLRGDTLIESYWRSVAMPGQGLFIGEPLARPWPVRE